MSFGALAAYVGSVIGACIAGAWWVDRRDWNGGRCRRHLRRWRHFDTDSQGGRGYSCDRGCNTWISWPVDRRVRSTVQDEALDALQELV